MQAYQNDVQQLQSKLLNKDKELTSLRAQHAEQLREKEAELARLWARNAQQQEQLAAFEKHEASPTGHLPDATHQQVSQPVLLLHI